MSRIYLRGTKVEISFRDAYDFPSTNYGAFGLFRYPAKFIPQVVLYVLREYTTPKDIIFDPFAGYGTVGFASRITGNSYELWDLNPILELIHRAGTIYTDDIFIIDRFVQRILNTLKKREGTFLPKWSNLDYWFPSEFFEILGHVWYNAHGLDIPEKPLVLLALLRVTRYFSYSDEKVYKLYKSKKAKSKIETLLFSDWEKEFYIMLEKELRSVIKRIGEYRRLSPKRVGYTLKAGTDVFVETLDSEVDVLITSPPYLQAQEYIRSTKLELYWLGYSEDYIKELSRKEIPYRKDVPDIKIHSETYERVKEEIKSSKLKDLYERYFKSIIYTLSTLSEKVRKRMFVFVGPVHIEEIKVPIDDIVAEHFSYTGWIYELTYVDKVKSRAMFNTKDGINPASRRRNSRMETEHLVVLSRHD